MTYKSNVQSVIVGLKNKVILGNPDEMYREISLGIMASNNRRIHNEGRNINESQIGDYSTKKMYVNPINSPVKFSPNPNRKTRKFDTGYKGYRGFIGRDTTKVNLQLSGALKADFKILKIQNGYALGFESARGKDISEGMESKYHSPIWGITKTDETMILEIVKRYVSDANK